MLRKLEPSTERANPDTPEDVRERAQARLRLVFSGDRVASRLVDLDPAEPLTLGRGTNVDVALEDSRVSRAHARVVWDGRLRLFRFADQGSANGTFVNGKRASAGVLSDQDVLRVGNSFFVVETKSPISTLETEAMHASGSNLSVLILGETGTGKEVLGRRIHARSNRRGQFVAVNCATLTRDLASAELFGHTRAAFSGATDGRAGLFRAAHHGTLFLDEIGDLAPELQPILLRALELRSIRPVGADHEVAVDVRIISATNANLDQLAQRGQFRDDLLGRLQQIVFKLPPLRERRGAILSLAGEFAPGLGLSADAAEVLLLHDWPKNVRELRAAIESFVALHPDTVRLGSAALLDRIGARPLADSPIASIPGSNVGRTQLEGLLRKHAGNVAAVARELKKPRSHVYRWMRNFGVSK